MTAADELDPEKVRAAFFAGIAYHDALMEKHVQAPEARGTLVTDERLDALLATWHNRIAEALGVPP